MKPTVSPSSRRSAVIDEMERHDEAEDHYGLVDRGRSGRRSSSTLAMLKRMSVNKITILATKKYCFFLSALGLTNSC